MNAEFFWIECSGCQLTWKMSLLDCLPDRALACPFCGNQHFEQQKKAALFNAEGPEGSGAKARRTVAENETQSLTWM